MFVPAEGEDVNTTQYDLQAILQKMHQARVYIYSMGHFRNHMSLLFSYSQSSTDNF